MKDDDEGLEPTTEWIQRLRLAAMKAINEDDMREIFLAMVAKAKKGDMQATRMLMTYLQPPPSPPATEPAQRLTAKTVNIYAGRPRKGRKLLVNGAGFVDRPNGAHEPK